MIAAVYAGKSTDQDDWDDDAQSAARQVEHACACAVEMGWTVADARVYVDDGISGAESSGPEALRSTSTGYSRAPSLQTSLWRSRRRSSS